jgi:LysM repeat protein
MRLLALIFLLQCSIARAKTINYSARAGDTPESIAADFYGNRALAIYISEGNGLARDAKLRAGQRVRVPTASVYKVRRGDTLEALAQRFLDDKRRATILASMCGLKPGDKLREGQDLTIPFQHTHRAEAPESLQSVARTFYGDAGRARMLAEYNFRSAPLSVLAKGEKVLVPIGHVRIRAVRMPAAPAPPRPGNRPLPTVADAQTREAELAARVSSQLERLEKAYKDGGYSDVPAALDKLLTEEDPSEAQLAEIFRLKAFSFVALGLDDLAVNAFREVLARKPDVRLDEATVSPKIRAALDRAKKAPSP